MPRVISGAVTAAVLALVVLACADKETDPNDPTHYFKPTSPENVLRNLMRSYVNRDIAAYEGVMAGEFIFVANRVEPDLGFDDLDREQDRVSTLRMFGAAQSIDVSIAPFAAQLSGLAVYPASEGYLQIDASDIHIEVTVPDAHGGDPVVWLVAGDPATFVFKPDSLPDQVNYTIVYQRDLYSGGDDASRAGTVSWSRLKAEF